MALQVTIAMDAGSGTMAFASDGAEEHPLLYPCLPETAPNRRPPRSRHSDPKFIGRIESGLVVDTTMPSLIIPEAFHKSLGRKDLRRERRQGPDGQTAGSSGHGVIVPPNQACFLDWSGAGAAAWEGQP